MKRGGHQKRDNSRYSVGLNLYFLMLYELDNPLGIKKVRQALIYSIDKDAISKHVLLAEGKSIGHFD